VKNQNNTLQPRPYWDLDAWAQIRLTNKQDYYDGLLYHLEEAVKCRTRSAYPVGTELSGGLDSSVITGIAHGFLKQRNEGIITFSNTLAEDVTDPELLKMDEKKYIEEVIRFNGIEDYEYLTAPAFDNVLDQIDFCLEVNDGLDRFSLEWQLPSKQAAMQKGVRTLFSGFPGDQMVTSLSKAYYLDYLDKKQYLAYFFADKKHSLRFNKLRPFLPHSLVTAGKAFKNWIGLYPEAVRRAADFYKIPAKYKRNYREYFKSSRLFKEQYLSYRHAQKCILLKPDVAQRMETETRFGAYYKIEPRFPMADIRLNQYFSALPNNFKYEGAISRSFYKIAVKKYLPKLIQEKEGKWGSVAPFMKSNRLEKYKLLPKLLETLPYNDYVIDKERLIEKLENYNKRSSQNQQFSSASLWDINILGCADILRWKKHN
jgi:asparagine synthase (glutamine-hydrolysing)